MIDTLFHEIESLERWTEFQSKHLRQAYFWLCTILFVAVLMSIAIYEGYGNAIFDMSSGGMIFNFFYTWSHIRIIKIDYKNDLRKLRKLQTFKTKVRIEEYERLKREHSAYLADTLDKIQADFQMGIMKKEESNVKL